MMVNRSEAVAGFVLEPYRTFEIAITDPEASTGFCALNDADPLNKNNAGIGVVVPIEDTAHLMR
jgi:DNA/RNA endonuclease G (NUC1)